MGTFIALRKRDQEEPHPMQNAPMDEKRDSFTETPAWDVGVERLTEIGFAARNHGEDTFDLEIVRVQRKPEDSFQRLPHLGGYVVDTASEEQAKKMCTALAPEYHVIPNVQLRAPHSMRSRTYKRRPPRDTYWPEESGVKLAHERGLLGEGVLVGVLDTGVDADHIELRKKRIDFSYVPLNPANGSARTVHGFDPNGHGTHVCGIIAGQHVGIAPKAELMVSSVIESETLNTSLERLAVALNWMLSHFKLKENLKKPTIINMSLGFRREWLDNPQEQAAIDGMKHILRTLVEDFDVLPIVAIGNDGPSEMRAPGYFLETLSVGAVDNDGVPTPFSGGGISPISGSPEPNLVGYGVDILSSLERNVDRRSIYAEMSGTSMATPYVTGIAALYASADSALQGGKLRQHLLGSARSLDYPADRVGVGLARYV